MLDFRSYKILLSLHEEQHFLLILTVEMLKGYEEVLQGVLWCLGPRSYPHCFFRSLSNRP